MSGYIPGSLLREIIEREELRMFSEAKPGLADRIEAILDAELYAYESGCRCCPPDIVGQEESAARIVELFESVLKPDVPQ